MEIEQVGLTSDGAPDPFSPERLRLTHDFAAGIGVRKALLTVPVRKPGREWWVRVHSDEAFRLQTAVIELKEDRETYLVAAELWPQLAAEATFSPRLLTTAINRQGVLFLWPARLPGHDGRLDEWSRSALEAMRLAQSGWVRIAANMSLGAYEVFTSSADLPEPIWPDINFAEILKIAFKDKLITSFDHPVLKRLRGEV